MNEKPARWTVRLVDILPADLPGGDFSAKGLRKLDPRKTCLDCGYLYFVTTHQVDVSENGYAVFESETGLASVADRQVILRGGNNQVNAMNLCCFRGVWGVAFSDNKYKMVEEGLKQATRKRKCPLFFPYSAGDSPEAHRELHRERTARHYNLIVGLIGAIIGGALSLAGTLLYWYLSQGGK